LKKFSAPKAVADRTDGACELGISMKAAINHIVKETGLAYAGSLAANLDRAAQVLKDSVPGNSSLVSRFDLLRERLQHSHIHLAVLGQFKRGKSSFINALLGVPLLPIAVVPLTAVPIFISWRLAGLARVNFKDARPAEDCSTDDPDALRKFLHHFVAEEANPENRLGVDRVDLLYPAPMLADGTVLIDTPGVGSTFRHNTEAALRVLPECDAVLFVVSADPPITEAELEYLRHFESKAAKIIFLLNKIDYLQSEERARVAEFLQHVLEQNRLWPADARIFCVSARDGLEAKQRGNLTAIRSSGMAEVEAYLTGHLAAEKTRLLEHAIRGKARDILSQAAADVSLRRRALEMPLEELALKSREFEQALASIEEQRKTTRDLLTGEQRRARDLERRIEMLRGDASRKLAAAIEGSIAVEPDAWGSSGQELISGKISEIFEDARHEFATTFAKTVDSVLSAHQARIDAMIASVRRTAAEIFDIPLRQHFEQASFEFGEEPYWVTENVAASLIPDSSRLIDQFLTKSQRMRRARARVIQATNELLVRNAENLRWAVLRGIEETFRRASAQFEERLDDAIEATKGVIQEGLARKRDRSFAAASELDELGRANDLLAALQEEFSNAETDGVSESESRSFRAIETSHSIV
jgi:GTP-binding protein EngB required for normal cell division